MDTTTTRNKLYSSIFSVCFVIFIIIASVYIVCFFNKDMLYNLLIKYDTPKNLPFSLSTPDLKKICNELMSYLFGKLDFLETKVTINGVLTDFYSVRSKVHMGDVRNIFKNLLFLALICIAVCIYSLFRLMKDQQANIKTIKNAYTKTLIIFAIIFAFLFTFAAINFDTFFIKFHQILFTNDLWLLDPSCDYIICLLPEEIFMNIGIRIAITIIVLLLLFYLCLHILSKTQPRQEAK